MSVAAIVVLVYYHAQVVILLNRSSQVYKFVPPNKSMGPKTELVGPNLCAPLRGKVRTTKTSFCTKIVLCKSLQKYCYWFETPLDIWEGYEGVIDGIRDAHKIGPKSGPQIGRQQDQSQDRSQDSSHDCSRD